MFAVGLRLFFTDNKKLPISSVGKDLMFAVGLRHDFHDYGAVIIQFQVGKDLMFAVGLRRSALCRRKPERQQSRWKRPDVCGGIETWQKQTNQKNDSSDVGKDLMFAVGLRRYRCDSFSTRTQFRWKRPDVCGGIETPSLIATPFPGEVPRLEKT